MSAKKSKDNRDTIGIVFSVCQQLTSIPNSSLAIISSTCAFSLSRVHTLQREGCCKIYHAAGVGVVYLVGVVCPSKKSDNKVAAKGL